MAGRATFDGRASAIVILRYMRPARVLRRIFDAVDTAETREIRDRGRPKRLARGVSLGLTADRKQDDVIKRRITELSDDDLMATFDQCLAKVEVALMSS